MEASAVFGLYLVLLVVGIILGTVSSVMMGLWGFYNAKEHNIDNPALWGVLIGFTGFIGLIIYAVMRGGMSRPAQDGQAQSSGGKKRSNVFLVLFIVTMALSLFVVIGAVFVLLGGMMSFMPYAY